MSELLAANKPDENVFVRVSFHIADKLPGTRSRGLPAIMSAFIYGAYVNYVLARQDAIDLTELYIADEVSACGTSAFISPIIEIDARVLPAPATHPLTTELAAAYEDALISPTSRYVTKL